MNKINQSKLSAEDLECLLGKFTEIEEIQKKITKLEEDSTKIQQELNKKNLLPPTGTLTKLFHSIASLFERHAKTL